MLLLNAHCCVTGFYHQAVLDRVDEQFEFPLPGEQERLRMLEMFFHQYIRQPTKKGKKIQIDPEVDSDFLQSVARQTEGFSGRQLAKVSCTRLFGLLLINVVCIVNSGNASGGFWFGNKHFN